MCGGVAYKIPSHLFARGRETSEVAKAGRPAATALSSLREIPHPPQESGIKWRGGGARWVTADKY